MIIYFDNIEVKTTIMRILALIFLCVLRVSAQDAEPFFKAEDFTAENLFTNNIEGPAFDENGRLFVVNFQKDGTIGLVKPDGTAELFVELPKGKSREIQWTDEAVTVQSFSEDESQ